MSGLKKLIISKSNNKFIYLISPNKIKNTSFYDQLKQIFKLNKVSFFQLRLKKESKKNKIIIGKKIQKICKKYKVKFIINDEPLLAKKLNADGCHLGQSDMSYKSAKKILGNKIIGITCHNSKKLALKAKENGANYIAFGSFFKSPTKKSALKANLTILRWAKKKINMPTVAVGGINSSNYKKILSNGANFIACSSYVWNNKKLDPVSAIKKLE